MSDKTSARPVRTWEDLNGLFNGLNERAKNAAEQRPVVFKAIDNSVGQLKTTVDEMLTAHAERMAKITVDLPKTETPAPAPKAPQP